MSKIYSAAPSGVPERVAHIMQLFHRPLFDAGVKVDVLSVADTDPECEHALKLRGVPAYAIVRILDIKQRTKGHGDAEIIIDEGAWLMQSDATKDAIIDHELEHLEVILHPKTKRVRLDCAGRPRMKMRLHDAEFGWFQSVAERHGAASIECKQATKLFLNHTQTFFAFVISVEPKQLAAANA